MVFVVAVLGSLLRTATETCVYLRNTEAFELLRINTAVSEYIRKMPFLWLEIDDEPGPYSMRGYIERNAIALVSNFNFQRESIDPPSENWLGLYAKSEKVNKSGMWNSNHVDEDYDPDFLNNFEELIDQ